MSITKIDAYGVKAAFLSAAAALDNQKEWINELNVFPVPDGDTGTNMTLTIMSAANEVASINMPDMETVCKTISSGSLRGARGNSGVILSQLLRGFCKVLKEQKYLTASVLTEATQRAVQTAYKAVMKPKEGTILTVAKAVQDRSVELAGKTDDLEYMLSEMLIAGNDMLQKTPDMLPVLKQAGVVDSGGQGLMLVLQGAFDAVIGNPVPFDGITSGGHMSASGVPGNDIETVDIKFGYCTEFIINASLNSDQEIEFKAFLESIGDSIVCVSDDDLTKIHVHTNDPGVAISKALTYGELSRMKIDNMREEHNERYTGKTTGVQSDSSSIQETGAVPKKKYGIISVSVGDGLNDIFKSLGVDYIIEGGQTMNPSTEDVLAAIEKVNSDVIFVLPNNKNIVLAANQAAALSEEKDVYVISTSTIPQGISAMLGYSEENSVDENISAMQEAISNVKSGEITYAIRDTLIDDFTIHANDIMFISDKGMLAVENNITDAVLNGLERMVDDSSELINIYYGTDISEDAAGMLSDIVSEKYPDIDVSLNNGGQPVYYYFISVE